MNQGLRNGKHQQIRENLAPSAAFIPIIGHFLHRSRADGVSEMRLIADWQWVVTRAWSVRLIVIAAILSGLEVALSVMTAFSVNPGVPAGVFAAFSGAVTFAALIARFVAQRPES